MGGFGITTPTGEYRINEEIRVREVRLIGADNTNFGVVSLREALERARQAELDLVEVAPQADPPVCRIMNYGKFLYERSKKDREAKKQQKVIEVKEIRLRPKTTDHHRSFKVRDARRWLLEGMKVKVRIRFRGREITYPEIARGELKEIADELADVGIVEQNPDMEGRTMLMVLAPAKKDKEPAAAPKEAPREPREPREPKDKGRGGTNLPPATGSQ